jgi:hypothetical protein
VFEGNHFIYLLSFSSSSGNYNSRAIRPNSYIYEWCKKSRQNANKNENITCRTDDIRKLGIAEQMFRSSGVIGTKIRGVRSVACFV